MNFPALDLVSLGARIHGAVAGDPLGYSGNRMTSFSFGTNAKAGLVFTTAGLVEAVVGAQGTLHGDTVWGVGVAGADYEIRAVMNSGTTTPTGNIPLDGSWAPLSVNRGLEINAPGLGTQEDADFLITIREIAAPLTLTEAIVVLNVENFT